nr:MAG TPA: hypothetical protein [Caudoviricetes sp.]
MFGKDKLQSRIDELLDEMEMTPRDTDEYRRLSDEVVKLTDLQTRKRSSNTDVKAAVLGASVNVVAILAITQFEKENVITSKVFDIFRNRNR